MNKTREQACYNFGMNGEAKFLVPLLIYVAIGIVSFFIFRWFQKFEDDLFDRDGYFGKYLVMHHGYYGSIPEEKGIMGKEEKEEAKKRKRIYWLTMVPLGYIVGIFAFGTFPVCIILSLVFPSGD